MAVKRVVDQELIAAEREKAKRIEKEQRLPNEQPRAKA